MSVSGSDLGHSGDAKAAVSEGSAEFQTSFESMFAATKAGLMPLQDYDETGKALFTRKIQNADRRVAEAVARIAQEHF